VAPVANDTWNHAAVTYDGTFNLYLNGSHDQQEFVGEPACAVSIQPASVGAALTSTATSSGAFNGNLDEVRISMTARSEEWLRACFLSIASNDWFTSFQHSGLPGFTLTIDSMYGGVVPLPGIHTNEYGTECESYVANSVSEDGTTQYVCSGWIGTGSAPVFGTGTNTGVFILTSDSSVVWQWGTNFYLDTGVVGDGVVDQDDDWFPVGSNVSVGAMPLQYSHFDSWLGDTGGCVIVSNTIDVLMDVPRWIDAVFIENTGVMGTPEWWLAEHGITGAVPEIAELGDADLDRMFNWQEWVAGTDPTNDMSLLSITNVWEVGTDDIYLVWDSVTGRTYAVQWCSNIVYGVWYDVADSAWTNVPGDGNPVTYTNVGSEFSFFRVKVVRP
jgi:hypothetical protein